MRTFLTEATWDSFLWLLLSESIIWDCCWRCLGERMPVATDALSETASKGNLSWLAWDKSWAERWMLANAGPFPCKRFEGLIDYCWDVMGGISLYKSDFSFSRWPCFDSTVKSWGLMLPSWANLLFSFFDLLIDWFGDNPLFAIWMMLMFAREVWSSKQPASLIDSLFLVNSCYPFTSVALDDYRIEIDFILGSVAIRVVSSEFRVIFGSPLPLSISRKFWFAICLT